MARREQYTYLTLKTFTKCCDIALLTHSDEFALKMRVEWLQLGNISMYGYTHHWRLPVSNEGAWRVLLQK